MNAKRKSHKRFEQLNQIVDAISPTLPTAAHVAVLFICYRHARENGRFQVSTKRIANSSTLSERHVKRIMDDLERLLVIRMETEHQGPVPRRYRITGQPAMVTSMSPIEDSESELMVTSTSANGDIHVTTYRNRTYARPTWPLRYVVSLQ